MKTVDEYLDQLNSERKSSLNRIRQRMYELLPDDAYENMDYKMPTFIVDGYMLFSLASQKHHMALYVMPFDLLEDLKEELSLFDAGKSCIRFRQLTDERLDALSHIIRYVIANQDQSQLNKKYPAKSKND